MAILSNMDLDVSKIFDGLYIIYRAIFLIIHARASLILQSIAVLMKLKHLMIVQFFDQF